MHVKVPTYVRVSELTTSSNRLDHRAGIVYACVRACMCAGMYASMCEWVPSGLA